MIQDPGEECSDNLHVIPRRYNHVQHLRTHLGRQWAQEAPACSCYHLLHLITRGGRKETVKVFRGNVDEDGASDGEAEGQAAELCCIYLLAIG
jgi:hypothetical protein